MRKIVVLPICLQKKTEMLIRYIFKFALLVPCAVFLFSIVANGQTAVSYRFLEVLDTDGKPVANAEIETIGHRVILQTNQDGQIEKGLPVFRGDRYTPGFKVSKSGYFSYEDIGFISGPFSDRTGQPIRLELLIIPKTDAERKAVGDEQRKREFFLAAINGDSAAVRKLLRAGLSANLTTADLRGVPITRGIPIIAFAAASGDGETVSALFDADAELSNRSQAENDILLYYLSGDINLPDSTLDKAKRIEKIERYEEGLRKLIKAGADVNAVQSGTGRITLIIAAANKPLGVIKKLLDSGVSINSEDYNENTALTEAVRYQRPEVVDLLLKSGAVKKSPTDSRTLATCRNPVLEAVYTNDLVALQSLIANKADVNQTCKGESALLRAVINKRIEAIKMLLKAGASVRNENGRRALEIARERQSTDIYHYQVDYKKIIELLEAAGVR